MEILSAILCFLQIANISLSLKDKFKTSDTDKEILSNSLLNMGNLLNSVADDLEQGIYPHGKCAEMEIYAHQLKSVLKDKMTVEEVDKLSGYMNESLQVERLLGQLNQLSKEQKQENLKLLRMAAGSFVAYSTVVKLK